MIFVLLHQTTYITNRQILALRKQHSPQLICYGMPIMFAIFIRALLTDWN